MHESGIEPARTSGRDSGRSARAIIVLAVFCLVYALLASRRLSHQRRRICRRARRSASRSLRPSRPGGRRSNP